MTTTADAVVVGGGLHGCSAALHLALAGMRPLLIEKDHVGRHASGVNAGGVRRLGRDLAEVPLSVAASECWMHIRDLVGDGCGFVPAGQLKLAENETELAALGERAAHLRTLGFDHERVIDRDELRCLAPAVAAHCVGATWVEGDGFADPARTVQAFARRLRECGGEIRERTAVRGVERRGADWRVTTTGGSVDTPVVVNCAGAWGARIAALCGERLPLTAHAPMLMITARVPPMVAPVIGAAGRTLSFKQFPLGTVLIGGGQLGQAFPDTNLTRLDGAGLALNARTAATLIPDIAGATVVRCWAGIEGFTPDGLPFIGASAREGVFHAFGFSAHGFQLGPAVGAVIADLVTRRPPAIDIDPFAPSRFEVDGRSA